MKHLFAGCICAFSLASTLFAQPIPISSPPVLTPDRSSAPIDPSWPRELERDGCRLVYHQPQIVEWPDLKRIKARISFTLNTAAGSTVAGIAELEGSTVVNRDKRSVFIEKLRLVSARFPSLPENEAAAMEAQLKRIFPLKGLTLSLDRLLSSLDRDKPAVETVEVQTKPPPIFSSTTPAALLIVQGTPVLAPAGDSGLQFVVNTNWDLFFDPATQDYYLLVDKLWVTAKSLAGEWSFPPKLPEALKELPKDWAHAKTNLPFKATKGMTAPKIYYSDVPAELIAFQGAPAWEKIPGTKLSWARNSDSWVFKYEEAFYYLVSGRWFTAPALEGPWSYAGNELPEDFRRIPESHACADVLACVPGTTDAADAVRLAQIPVEAIVKKSAVESKVAVTYDGEPEFVAIPETAISYARNSASDVLKLKDRYYLCQDAVWFTADSAAGPWKVCTSVPADIYSIPPESPLYRVTYVKTAAGGDDNTALSSYTAGYLGSYIASGAGGAVLVWGTGWNYPPYLSGVLFRPYYPTYGGAAAYNPWAGCYAVGQRWYGPYANAGRAAWYNPKTGAYGRGAAVQGAYGARTLAAGYNPHSDVPWNPRQGNTGYAQWGTSAVQRGDDWVRAWNILSEEGRVAGKAEDVYAGADGNLYRREPDGWSKYKNGEWAKLEPDAGTLTVLAREVAARSRGSAQTIRQANCERNGFRMDGSRGIAGANVSRGGKR